MVPRPVVRFGLSVGDADLGARTVLWLCGPSVGEWEVGCPGCGEVFVSRVEKRKYCSSRCRERVKSRRPGKRAVLADQSAFRGALKRRPSGPGGHEKVVRSKVWERDEGVCHLCREACDPENWHLDHVVPVSAGGLHAYSNVAVSHPSCNQLKGDRWDTPSGADVLMRLLRVPA